MSESALSLSIALCDSLGMHHAFQVAVHAADKAGPSSNVLCIGSSRCSRLIPSKSLSIAQGSRATGGFANLLCYRRGGHQVDILVS